MRQSKNIFSLFQVFIFLTGQILTSAASAQLRIPGPLGNRGVTVETVPIRDCNPDGTNCRPVKGSQPYNTVQTMIQVDGHFFAVEAVVNRHEDKVIYLGASFAQKSNSSEMMDPETAKTFQFLESTKGLNSIQQNLPGLAQGISNVATALQVTQQIHDQLKGSYNDSLAQLRQIGNNIQNRADDANEIAKFNQGLVSAVIGASLTQIQDPRVSAQYGKYLEAFNDPWSVKKYSLTEDALRQVQNEYDEAIAENNFYAATEAARVLLNQAEDSLSRKAAAQLKNHFTNGVLNTKSFGAPQKSVLDDARLYTSAKSPYGQAIRHVANKSQKLWLSSNGLKFSNSTEAQAYTMGNAALRAADESFAAGKSEQGVGLLSVAETMIDLGSGISRGLLNNLSSTIKAVPFLASAIKNFSEQAINDPAAAAVTAQNFLRNVPGLVEAIAMDYVAKASKLQDGSAYERGEVIGEIAGELVTIWLTEGTLSAVKGVAKAGKVAVEATRVTKVAAEMAEKAVVRAQSIATHFPGPRSAGLVKIASKDAAIAVEVMNTVEHLTYKGQKDAAEFIGKAVSAESDYIMTRGGAKKVVEVYQELSSKIPLVPKVNFQGPITRGVEETITLADGTVVKNNLGTVFKDHDGMMFANGRASMGGPEGQKAMYVIAGKGNDVNLVIAQELSADVSEIVFGTTDISLKNGLDLTDQNVLSLLNIKSGDLLVHKSQSGAYLVPQAIGDIARKNGFDFLIIPSTIDGSLKNLIIFR